MSADDRVAYWKRRTACAEAQVDWATREAESLRNWMTATFTEERRLHDRITHLYGTLRALGLTAEQIDGPLPNDIAVVGDTLIHRVLAGHAPYEMCDECPTKDGGQ